MLRKYDEACMGLLGEIPSQVYPDAVIACLYAHFRDKESLTSWTTYKTSLIRGLRLRGAAPKTSEEKQLEARCQQLHRSLATTRTTVAQRAAPIEPPQLREFALQARWQLPTMSYNSLRLYAMAVCMCTGMLRVREAINLCWDQVTMNTESVTVEISTPKERRHTSPGKCHVQLPELSRPWLSPLVLIRTLKTRIKTPRGQVFKPATVESWAYRTAHEELTKFLRTIKPEAGTSVRTHSLRSGGATFYLLQGAGRNVVQEQGRWLGNTIDLYFRPPEGAAAQALSQVGQVEPAEVQGM